jgi:hypothetical protein
MSCDEIELIESDSEGTFRGAKLGSLVCFCTQEANHRVQSGGNTALPPMSDL